MNQHASFLQRRIILIRFLVSSNPLHTNGPYVFVQSGTLYQVYRYTPEMRVLPCLRARIEEITQQDTGMRAALFSFRLRTPFLLQK